MNSLGFSSSGVEPWSPLAPPEAGKRRASNIRRSRAVTLLELMFAMAILGMAMVTLGVAVGRCLRGVAAADRVRMSLDVAQCRLAEWRVQAERENEVRTGTEDGERVIGGQLFTWQQAVEASDDPDLLTSRLTIRWKEGNLERERTFVELVRRINREHP